MRCNDVRKKLDLFAMQELATSMRDRMQAHLESCAECGEALARLRRLEGLLAASQAPPVPERLAARILDRARQQQPAAAGSPRGPYIISQRTWERIRLSAATAASLAVGLMLGLLMGHQMWQPGNWTLPAAASRSADPLAASGLDSLVEPGGDSLAQAYLRLTVTVDRQGPR